MRWGSSMCDGAVLGAMGLFYVGWDCSRWEGTVLGGVGLF